MMHKNHVQAGEHSTETRQTMVQIVESTPFIRTTVHELTTFLKLTIVKLGCCDYQKMSVWIRIQPDAEYDVE